VDTAFFIMGGPINDGVNAMMAGGHPAIDVRHEQAAAFMMARAPTHACADVRSAWARPDPAPST
jgi:acetolactate synthase-1/2/3 large subunit